jgi:hypothetical protein
MRSFCEASPPDLLDLETLFPLLFLLLLVKNDRSSTLLHNSILLHNSTLLVNLRLLVRC